MALLRLISIVALSLLATPLPSNAQEPSSDQKNLSNRNMRVIVFGGQLESVYYEYRGEKIELTGGQGSLSYGMPIPKDRILELYYQLPPDGAASKKQADAYRPVGRIALPEGSKVILLLEIPEDLATGQIKGRAFKDSHTRHPANIARVFNLAPQEIAIRAGTAKLSLRSGETDFMAWQPRAFNSVSYQVAIRNQEKTEWEVVESAECAGREDLRTFVFIVDAIYEGKHAVTAITVIDPVHDKDEE